MELEEIKQHAIPANETQNMINLCVENFKATTSPARESNERRKVVKSLEKNKRNAEEKSPPTTTQRKLKDSEKEQKSINAPKNVLDKYPAGRTRHSQPPEKMVSPLSAVRPILMESNFPPVMIAYDEKTRIP